ncbi:MAG: DAK2 domain-containing protein [Eubacterium sp.]|nr:DAK2 domain-containing protein [Eubacterium sp.]
MSLNTIDAAALKRYFISGANNINNNKEYINELNVFPVPDGDTGTNMTLTIMTAAAEVEKLEKPTIDSLAKAISNGSLRGARGNSGVILSQLFRGFCKDIKGKDKLYPLDIALAFSRAVDTAYKAVMKPKEGTILTVAKGMSEKASEIIESDDPIDMISFADQILSYGEEVLEKTPEMLPVLKEAGVVDSGGQGLVEVIRGAILAMKGEDVTSQERLAAAAPKAKPAFKEINFSGSSNDHISTADIKFGYCTEFIIMLDKPLSDEEVEAFKEYLLSIGDSLVCVADEEIVKVHVHTNHPGLAFEKALGYGALTRMKIDNMREEHTERVILNEERTKEKEKNDQFKKIEADKATHVPKPSEPPKKYGFVAVAVGDGISDILKDIGIDHIISGGQTMNPSTEDILSAVKQVNAENVFVFPNNKNIVLAATQAANIFKEKNIIVIPTASVPQSISAMIEFDAEADPETNKEALISVMDTVKTGEVTYAVRDTSLDGKTIKKGDIMGINGGGIAAVGEDINETTFALVEDMVDEDSGLVTIYYGEEIEKEKAEELTEKLSEKFADLEIDVHYGGQPIYYYIVSVE